MKFEQIDKLVINLPERIDRLESIRKVLNGHFFQVVSGVRMKPVHAGIAQAHLNCISIAKQRKMSFVCIMEDDLQLRKGWLDYLDSALNELPENWDILLGGVYEGTPVRHNNYWSSVGEFCGLHFYIVNASAYDKILGYEGKQHIDRWMNFRGNGLKCFVLNKFIATQSAGKSDNTGTFQDYSHMIKKTKLL